jgi:hypothetical protein
MGLLSCVKFAIVVPGIGANRAEISHLADRRVEISDISIESTKE